MEIKSREDANNYYNKINLLVDEYIDKWKIKPSNLKRYMQPGSDRFNRFLERNHLKNINGTEIILKDVIEDRVSMETDQIATFESFRLFESDEFKIDSLKRCLYKGIEKADINMEKFLADYFDTNLGSISVLDSDKHFFRVDDWNGDGNVIVLYSQEEFEIIKLNIFEFFFQEVSRSTVPVNNLVAIELQNLIDYDNFVSRCANKFSEDFIISLVQDTLGSNFVFVTKGGVYYMWANEDMR